MVLVSTVYDLLISACPILLEHSRMEDPAVSNFRKYLRIKTVHPAPDYDCAVGFLKDVAADLGLSCSVVETTPKTPVVVMTWKGTDSSLPSILLNSHVDVVPVFEEHWKHDPFGAHKDEDGNIYARGSQDMKCVGMQYVEAVRRLKISGKTFPRSFHLLFVPDEEIHGGNGMFKFIEMEAFKNLNIGFALDEGIANPGEELKVFYGERTAIDLTVTCPGNSGHGSQFVENNAGEKIRRIVNSFLEYREKEERRLRETPRLTLGDVVTCNFTMVEGGVQPDVLPAEMKAVFDVRIPPTFDVAKFLQMVDGWCHAAGEGVTYKTTPIQPNKVTSISPDDPWFMAFNEACKSLGLKTEFEIFPAGTDSSLLRKIGYPALGFSPMNHTPILLHDHNEYLNEKVYLRGIDIYCGILAALGSVPVP